MTTYIISRLIQALVVLILVTLIVFLGMRILPGDPILLLATQESASSMTREEMALLRHKHGLDKPITTQYLIWFSNVLRGNLGRSILSRVPVEYEITQRFPITLHLGILSFILGFLIGVPAGIFCAIRRNSWLDNLLTIFANIGITMPIFWFGIILIYVFGLYLKWLPIAGYVSPFEDFWLSTRQIIMPTICLSLGPIAQNVRQTRSCMLEVLHQDYIRTAWSKGLKERAIIFRHALKNALIPVVTLSGMGLTLVLGGSVLIEAVFVIPGMGLLVLNSINSQDYPLVQGVVLVMAVMVLTINLLVDLTYGWLDPRIRYR